MRGHFSLVSLCAPIHSPSTTTKTITATANWCIFSRQIASRSFAVIPQSQFWAVREAAAAAALLNSPQWKGTHTHTHTFCRKKQAILPASRTTPSTTQLGAVRWVGLHSCKSVRPFYYATIIAAAEALGTATAATKAHKRLALFYCFLCFAVRPQRRARQLALATINLLLSLLLSPHQHHHHHQHCYHQQQQQFFFFFPATIANWESVAINFANRYLISSANWARGLYAFEREKKWANQIEVNLGKATSAVLQQNAAFSVWQREQQQAIFFISGRD